jgi:uncharacterized protein (DUF849 family)
METATGAHPATPLSPRELSDDAAAVIAAGAQQLHPHPRDAAGAESLRPDDTEGALSPRGFTGLDERRRCL